MQEENRGMKDAQGYKIRQEKKQKIEEAAAKAGQPSKDTAMRVSAIIILKYLYMWYIQTAINTTMITIIPIV